MTLAHVARTLLLAHPEYPRPFRELTDPPPSIRIAGTLDPIERAVGIVGTRRADEDAVAFTERLAADLARADALVVSGGARGIDAAAHRGALRGGGRTAVVLGSGLGDPYPPAHRDLYAEVIRTGGAVLSEQADAAAPIAARLLARNRLVAALVQVLVVVQAPDRSGALSTAAHAQRLHRQVLAVPAGPWDPRGGGCLALLRSGAGVCTSVRDVLSVAALQGGPSAPAAAGVSEKTNDLSHLDADTRAVLRALRGRPLLPDEVARAAGLPVARVLGALVRLRLGGLAGERIGGRWSSEKKDAHG